jgi:putative endonuclease
MSKHNETGEKGEQIAQNFLIDKGYNILFRNWKYGKKEVDIITHKNDMLVVVEVKTRFSHDFGYPEQFVTKQKQKFLKTAAEAFMHARPEFQKIQFDVISVILQNDHPKEIVHFEDAFY